MEDAKSLLLLFYISLHVYTLFLLVYTLFYTLYIHVNKDIFIIIIIIYYYC